MPTPRPIRLLGPLLALVVACGAARAQIVFEAAGTEAGGTTPWGVLVDDLNKDGDLDVVLGQGVFGAISAVILAGKGDGTFSNPVSIPNDPSGATLPVALGDFDEDEFPDLIVINANAGGPSSVVLREGVGNGTFEAVGTGINAGPAPADVVVDDFDGDDHLDVAIFNGGLLMADGNVVVRFGNGDGTFAPAVTPLTFDESGLVGWILSGDVDASGAPDLVVLEDDGTYRTLLSNGDRTFTAVCGSGCGLGAPVAGAALADVDADLRADLVTSEVRVALAQTGAPGTFGTVATIPLAGFPRDVALAHLDDDGILDLVVGRNGVVGILDDDEPAGDVVMLRGLGGGAFELDWTSSGVRQPRGLAVADFDEDSRTDVVVPSYSALAQNVTFLRNRTYLASEPFVDVGGELAGGAGVPVQLAEGTLVAGEPYDFRLVNAKPFGSAVHIVGLELIDIPFKGGVIRPDLDLVNGPLPIGADGSLVLAGPWPTGGSGATLYLQFWFADPGAVQGFAASSTVEAVVP